MPSSDDDSSILRTEEDVLRPMKERARGTDLRIPPRCFEEMNGEIQRYDPEAQTLQVQFPVETRYENPMRVMQGGFLSAALDNVLGPLSYLVAPPSVTTRLDVRFLRPVTREYDTITVSGTVEDRTDDTLELVVRQVFHVE